MYSSSFGVTLIALTMITSQVILAVTSNVVLSLGMVGALSIVRFRTAIKEPLDIAFLFWSIAARRISRGGALHRKGESNSRVVPPFPESPRCLRPFQGKLFSLHCLHFQAQDRLTPRLHVGQPCGTALWESLERKPQIP